MAGIKANQFVHVEGKDCFQSKTFWKDMMHELEADNFMLGLDGKDHIAVRRMFKTNFSKQAVEPHCEDIHQLCIEMFADIQAGEEFEVVERVLQLTSQMIGCIMTGKVPTRKELKEFIYYVNEITNHFNLKRLPVWLLKFKPWRFRNARTMTIAFAENLLEEHLTTRPAIANYIDAVNEAAEKCPHLFTKGDVRFSAIMPFFVGIDTLGQTINYGLFELHRHPPVLAELQNEVDQVFSNGVPNTSELRKMPVMNSVIRETLRLHPSAFGMVRTATRDFEFEGHLVKKDQDIVILTTATHFMDEYFRNPGDFDIERFQPPRNEHRRPHVLAPFGLGPHACLGAGMAETLMGLALGSILYHYKFEALDPTVKYKERINPTPSLGSAFKLTRTR